jgi:hypothetical protein
MADRLAALLESTTLNGINFVEVTSDDQTSLVVHFLTTVEVKGTLTGSQPVTITGGETVRTVDAAVAGWSEDDEGRPLLALTAGFAGDFSFYELRIASPVLDPFFAMARFTFKARCPSDLDCGCVTPKCPPDDGAAPAIDYLARDFDSFKRALQEYSVVAYPGWQERSDADLGMTLLELLASVGDDLAYLQDRVAAEATLATATQRRSVIRHARLVDYEPRPATSARVTVQLDVGVGNLPAGTRLTAPAPDGGSVPFELGDGLVDRETGALSDAPLACDPRWNARDGAGAWRILPYWWDDARRCLPAGSTAMWVRGHGFGFPTGDPQLGTTGVALLIDTAAASTVDPPVREVVHLTGAKEVLDPLFGDLLTHLTWAPAEALAHDHDQTRTHLAGNLLSATEGHRHTDHFAIDPPPGPGPGPAVARQGPNAGCDDPVPIYLHTLTRGRLAWLGDTDGAVPELVVREPATVDGDPPRPWRWRRRLLDAAPFEAAVTVEPSRYVDTASPMERAAGGPRWEYDGDGADSIRFGDGVFGERPVTGARFEVIYRVTAGAAGNVGADTITGVDPVMAGIVLAATNPFAASGGADAEPLDRVRRLAPDAFKARVLRAVRAEDYDAAATELDWVLGAGTAFRWTGSWLTVFTTAQPRGGELPDTDELVALVELLDRRRLAGYEVYAPAPRYVGIDLIVTVCADPWALRGEVEAAVAVELGTGRRRDGQPAFFAPDRFRFGTPVERSEVEIACQRAVGVHGVVSIRHRRRGVTAGFEPMPETVTIGDDAIVRCDNDPSYPDRGSLRIVVEGGK